MPQWDSIIQRAFDAGGRLRVRSALNPMLWLCGIVTVPLMIASLSISHPPSWLPWVAVSPVGATILGFFFLLLFDRDKLQSEDYQLRKRSLELIQNKGQPFPIEAPSLEAITNPQVAGENTADGQVEADE